MVTGLAKRRSVATLAITAIAALLLSMTLPLWPAPSAQAAVNGMSIPAAATVGVNPSTSVVITIDADDGAGDVRLLATTGAFVDTACNGSAIDVVPLAGAETGGDGLAQDCAIDATSANATYDTAPGVAPEVQDVTLDDGPAAAAGGNMDTIIVYWVAPSSGPATASITATQGTSSKSVSITVRGAPNQVTLAILTAAPAAGLGCNGTATANIRSATSSANAGALATGALCTTVKDSAGNALPGVAVIYSTTKGTLSAATDTTLAATGDRGIAKAVTIAPGTTGVSGSDTTITATAGGVSATGTVKFGGDPATCTVTTNPSTVQTGGSSAVTVTVKDSAGGPPSDGIFVTVVQANPGAGANAAILGSPAPITAGVATVQVIAAIPGPISLGATAPTTAGGGASVSPLISCTGLVTATGTTATATATGTATATATPGAVTVTPNSPYVSGPNAVVVQGSASASAVAQSIATSSGKTVLALWVLTGGQWIYFLPAFPSINGGLSAFPGPVASAIVVLG